MIIELRTVKILELMTANRRSPESVEQIEILRIQSIYSEIFGQQQHGNQCCAELVHSLFIFLRMNYYLK